ncbi:hypothetical protein UFOVP1071_49 [uncultured Caudovirales phage]|uniref:Uncharacterized protein n=1 Tax=uncultured Caudovirales phage TaxID=2100421 RepID=A0A6J5QBD4_9CAUD|nr:hypothetical protein UFOVP1071_49 [uncultured Caudovirales phage]
MKQMDVAELSALETFPLEEAQQKAVAMLDPSTKPTRLNRLKYDISKARTPREVMRIMWNAYMAGTGYGVPTSQWQRHYKTC